MDRSLVTTSELVEKILMQTGGGFSRAYIHTAVQQAVEGLSIWSFPKTTYKIQKVTNFQIPFPNNAISIHRIAIVDRVDGKIKLIEIPETNLLKKDLDDCFDDKRNLGNYSKFYHTGECLIGDDWCKIHRDWRNYAYRNGSFMVDIANRLIVFDNTVVGKEVYILYAATNEKLDVFPREFLKIIDADAKAWMWDTQDVNKSRNFLQLKKLYEREVTMKNIPSLWSIGIAIDKHVTQML